METEDEDERLPRGVYSPEFREQAVRLHEVDGLTVLEVAKRISDITNTSTDEGWLYLAGLKDLFNGELVGYAMSERMTKILVMQALFRGVSARRLAKGLILHSDRGS